MALPRTDEPFGRRRYWPIFEAAVRNKFPIAIHVGGSMDGNSTFGPENPGAIPNEPRCEALI
ncbi:hypothetical protein [Bradyrhizobium sp. LB13.1]